MKHKAIRLLKKEIPFHLMILPGLIFLLVYSYIPMGGIIIAFQKFNSVLGVFKSPWVGLKNFQYILSLPDIYQVLWNTIFIALLKMFWGFIVPLIVALLLNEVSKSFVKRSIQTFIYLPYFLSWTILGGILIDMLSLKGPINTIIQHLGGDPVMFLASNSWFPTVLVASDVWKNFGFGTIVYMAAITGINPELYEAAHVDGANRWRQTWHVTLPGMMPIIVLLATLSLGSILNAGFEQIFTLYSPIVYQSGDILDTFVYRLGLIQAQFGPATAVGLFKGMVSCIFVSLSYYLAYKLVNYRIF